MTSWPHRARRPEGLEAPLRAAGGRAPRAGEGGAQGARPAGARARARTRFVHANRVSPHVPAGQGAGRVSPRVTLRPALRLFSGGSTNRVANRAGMWKQDASGRVHTPLEPVALGATLALIPVLIIEADATSSGWQQFATVANWII